MLLSLKDFVQHKLFDVICISWDEESEAVTCGKKFFQGCMQICLGVFSIFSRNLDSPWMSGERRGIWTLLLIRSTRSSLLSLINSTRVSSSSSHHLEIAAKPDWLVKRSELSAHSGIPFLVLDVFPLRVTLAEVPRMLWPYPSLVIYLLPLCSEWLPGHIVSFAC